MPLLPEGAALVAITSDPDEAARAPMGDAIVADVALTLEALLEQVPESSRAGPEPNPGPSEIPAADPLNSSTVHSALAEVLPEDAIVVLESPASTLALRNQLRISRPGSYYFSAGGGLGFGLAAAVGVQLAQPDRPVVCVVGEGSAQYAITAFWSAVAHDVPVTFLVLNNAEYAILKWFADVEQVQGAPGARPAEARRRGGRRRLRGLHRRRPGPRPGERCAGRGARILAHGAGRSPGRARHVPVLARGDEQPRRGERRARRSASRSRPRSSASRGPCTRSQPAEQAPDDVGDGKQNQHPLDARAGGRQHRRGAAAVAAHVSRRKAFSPASKTAAAAAQ